MGSPLLGFTAWGSIAVAEFRKEGKPGKEEVPSYLQLKQGKLFLELASTHPPVKQKMLSHLVLFGWMTIATSGSVMRSGRSVVMTRVERVCSGSAQCLPFSSCSALQGRNKEDTLQAIRQLQCGFSGRSPMVCCQAPSLPRKAVEGGGNPAVVNVADVNSRTNLDIGGLNARAGNFLLLRRKLHSGRRSLAQSDVFVVVQLN